MRMTSLGNKARHEQHRGRGFEALDAKSTWSSFDDITWDDFGDDHSVPEPDERPPTLWLRKKKDSKVWKEVREESQPSSKMDAETAAMDVDNWDSLNVGELGAVPDNLAGIGNELKQESQDDLLAGGVGIYNDEDSAIVSSGHFSFSGVANDEEMALFGGESDAGKENSLLGYTWENLDDMDTLFQSEETPFGHDAADSLLQWPASSSSPDSNSTVGNAKASPELRAMKGKCHEQDMKMEFIPCESFDKNTDSCPSNADIEKSATDVPNAEKEISTQDDIDKAVAKDSSEPLTSPKGKQPISEADKAHSGKRQASNKRRNDERSKKQMCPRRSGVNHSKQQPLTHYSSSQPLQLKPSVASTLQVYPQVMGPGTMQPQYIGPVHHSYNVMQSGQSQHSPAVMMCYDQGDAHSQQRFSQEARQKLELLSPPPPASGTNMTPQEKIEKLRWKQKMHRLASEQHQHMAKQCGLSINSHQALQNQQALTPPDAESKPGPAATVKSEEGEGASPAVLSQLLSIMSKLDVGTRICIRDALYRLARSAVTRHTSDGPTSSEGSNNSDTTLSRYPLLETETNPIDRTIANLLFHKRSGNSSNSSTPNYSNNNSSNSNGSVVNFPSIHPWNFKQQEAGMSPGQQHQQQLQELPSETTAEERTSTDFSAENAEEMSDGSRKEISKPPGDGCAAKRSFKSSLRKRDASSSSEFLSNEEGTGRGTSSSSSDSSIREAKTKMGML